MIGLRLPEREDTLMTADMIKNTQEGNTMMTELQKEGIKPFLNL